LKKGQQEHQGLFHIVQKGEEKNKLINLEILM